MDARYEASERALNKAFQEIVKEKPLYESTIKEVVKRAGINEATFYRHYEDIPDWKRKTEYYFLVELKNYVMEHISLPWREFYASYLIYLKEHSDYSQMLLSDNFRSYVLIDLFDLPEKSINSIPTISNLDILGKQCYDDLMFAHMGITSVVVRWVNSDFNKPIEEVVDFIGKKLTQLGLIPKEE